LLTFVVGSYADFDDDCIRSLAGNKQFALVRSWESKSTDGITYHFTRQHPRWSLIVSSYQYKDQEQMEGSLSSALTGQLAYPPPGRSAPSGFPLGDYVVVLGGKQGSIAVTAGCFPWHASVELDGSQRGIIPEDLTGLAETLVRTSFALRFGSQTRDADSKGVNSRTVSDTRKTSEGEVFVNLEQYLQCYDISPNWNKAAGRASWQKGTTTFVLVLGTSKLKVGSEWEPMSAQPIIVGQTWYVPLTSVDRHMR